MPDLVITADDLTGTDVVAFLRVHVDQLRATSPPGSSHALDVAGLRAPGVVFWVARDAAHDGELVGCAALTSLDPAGTHAELKSMRTAAHRTGEGIAARLLTHVLDHARAHGVTRISLETGSQDFFAPARRLYARHGFVGCEPFGSYRPDPSSVFLTRGL